MRMMKLFAVSVFILVCGVGVCTAQDRIYTKDGRIIDCRITDSRNKDGKIFYLPAGDSLTSHFIPTDRIQYFEVGNQRIVHTPSDQLKMADTRFPLKAPDRSQAVGVSFGYLSNIGRKMMGVTLSYAYFFDRSNGIYAGISCFGLGDPYYIWMNSRTYECRPFRNYVVIPQYERRFYIQRMGSFFFARAGIGVSIYKSSCEVESGRVELQTIAQALSVELGLDIRIARNLYFEFAGRFYGEFASGNLGDKSVRGLGHSGPLGGFSTGLRFGWGK